MRESAPARPPPGAHRRFCRIRVAVFGDFPRTQFIYGRIARVSRRRRLILDYDSAGIVPEAGNAKNVSASVGHRQRGGVAGVDDWTAPARGARARREPRGIVQPRGYQADQDTYPGRRRPFGKQQVMRIDRAVRPSSPPQIGARSRQDRVGRARDALLVSDYSTGLVTPAVVRASQRFQAPTTSPVLSIPLRAVGSEDDDLHPGAESEVEQLFDITIGENVRVLENGRACRRQIAGRAHYARELGWRSSSGPRGGAFRSPDRIRSRASRGRRHGHCHMTLALGGSHVGEAAHLANFASGVVVMKRGTATVSADELRQAVRSVLGGRPGGHSPAKPPPQWDNPHADLVDRVLDVALGLTFAFANGCFDLLRRTSPLSQAAAEEYMPVVL